MNDRESMIAALPDAVVATAERAWRELSEIADGTVQHEVIGREWARSLVLSYNAVVDELNRRDFEASQ